MEPNIDECFQRLKSYFNVNNDKDLASLLDLSPASISNYKNDDNRGFPYRPIILLARKHDLNINWVLFGDDPMNIDTNNASDITIKISSKKTFTIIINQ